MASTPTQRSTEFQRIKHNVKIFYYNIRIDKFMNINASQRLFCRYICFWFADNFLLLIYKSFWRGWHNKLYGFRIFSYKMYLWHDATITKSKFEPSLYWFIINLVSSLYFSKYISNSHITVIPRTTRHDVVITGSSMIFYYPLIKCLQINCLLSIIHISHSICTHNNMVFNVPKLVCFTKKTNTKKLIIIYIYIS